MSGCQRQCNWDENQICRTCGIDYNIIDESTKCAVDITPEEEKNSQTGS